MNKKILHISLQGKVTDGWNYQDNLLPKYHSKDGYDVSIITSQYVHSTDGTITVDGRSEYVNNDGVKIIRLKAFKLIPGNNNFQLFLGLKKIITKEKPDYIFLHGFQGLNIGSIINYVKNTNGIKLLVDNHADYSNSARTKISWAIHKLLWRKQAKRLLKYTNKFYGVTPGRVSFLSELYDLPEHKIGLLPLAADDELVEAALSPSFKNKYQKHFKDNKNQLLIVTGGKIDHHKRQILTLMQVIDELGKENYNVKLVVFGPAIGSIKENINKLSKKKHINYVGWVSPRESYFYLSMADLVVFPGRHSVFWEICVALMRPMLVKQWHGHENIDYNGNIKYIYNDSFEEIKWNLKNILKDNTLLEMKRVAANVPNHIFLYSYVAKSTIEQFNKS